jgi:hypothetical protein
MDYSKACSTIHSQIEKLTIGSSPPRKNARLTSVLTEDRVRNRECQK